MEDLELTFNESAFTKSIDNMVKSMNLISENVIKMTGLMEKSFTGFSEKKDKEVKKTKKEESDYLGAVTNLIGGMTKRVIGLGAAYLGLRQILRYLPEIGKTFEIAGDIVMRNLLWPLRQELIPLLQKVLNWVRDHREMFVQWGQVIANVFRAVKGWVEIVINAFKSMYKAFMSSWEGFFGKSKKTLFEWINVFIFHLTTVVIALQTLFLPLFEKIGKLFGQIAVYAHGFISGLIQGLGSIMTPLRDLIDLLKDVFSTFTSGDEDVKEIYTSLSIFGDFLGTTFVAAIQFVVSTLVKLWATIKGIAQGIKGVVEIMSGDMEAATKTFEGMVDTFKTGYTKAEEGYKKIGKGYEGFMQRTEAKVNPVGTTKTSTFNNTTKIDKIELKIDNADEAKKAGKDFVNGINEGFEETFKRKALQEKAYTGY